MPPKAAKRGGAVKRGGRITRSTLKAHNPPIESTNEEESVRIEDLSNSDAIETKKDTPMVDNSMDEANPGQKQSDSLADSKKDTELDEFGKDENLDLDDNEPEYEPEEESEDRELGQEEEKELEEEEIEPEEEIESEGGDDDDDENHVGEEENKHGDVEEEVEHHDALHERRKRKEFEIYVGGLDKGATEEDLKKVFGHIGEVTEIRIMKNSQTKKSNGNAFLRFAIVEQAKRAVKEVKNPVINGKKCGVTASQDNDTLFIGNICKTWTQEALREKLKHYGVENMDDITLVEDNNNANTHRGYAFLEFSSRSDALDAHKRLLKKDVMFGVETPAKVSFTDSFLDPEDEIMAQVKTIFIDGLSPSWNEEHVRDLLKKYGKLEKVELARNMPSARRKDFGFVTFDTHETAVSCAKFINNSELGEGDSKAKVRARLSRPLQKPGKSRQTSRSDRRSGRSGSGRSGRSSARLPPRSSLPSSRSARGLGPRIPPSSAKRAAGPRVRRPRPPLPPPSRARPLPPSSRSYDRRPPPNPLYPKARDYGSRRDELPPPRSRPAVNYRLSPERHHHHHHHDHVSYRDEYAPPRVSSGYSDFPPPRSSRSDMRRPLVDEVYNPRYERPLPPPSSYSEGRSRAYDQPLPGSKRPYAAMDDITARYAEVDVRHSRAHLDYVIGPSQYGESSYGERIPRSSLGYGSGKSAMSVHDSRGPYSSRQGMEYGAGSYGGGSDVGGGMYSSSYGGDVPRRDGGGGSSYSSIFSSRGLGGSSYSDGGGGGPGSYY